MYQKLNFFDDIRGHFTQSFPGVLDVLISRILSAYTEPNDIFFIYGGGNHMESSRCINGRQKLLIQLIGASQSEADQA